MPENIGSGDAPYNTRIPLLAENADIQSAFRLYHYGEDTNTPSGVLPEYSMARHLDDLESSKIPKTPTVLLDSVDLDLISKTGFYIQKSNDFALSGSHYPQPHVAGVLTVTAIDVTLADPVTQEVTGGSISQQYQSIGATESADIPNYSNKIYWRQFYAGIWTEWKSFIEESNFATFGNQRYIRGVGFISDYYKKSDADAEFLTKADANLRLYLQENVQTASYTLALSDLNKVVAMNNSTAADLTIPNNAGQNTSVAFPVGSVINVYRMTDSGVTIIPADETVIIRNAGLIYQQYTEISLRKRGLNEWVASGNIIPA